MQAPLSIIEYHVAVHYSPSEFQQRGRGAGGALLELDRAWCLFSVFDESSRLSSPSPLFVVYILLSHHTISL